MSSTPVKGSEATVSVNGIKIEGITDVQVEYKPPNMCQFEQCTEESTHGCHGFVHGQLLSFSLCAKHKERVSELMHPRYVSMEVTFPAYPTEKEDATKDYGRVHREEGSGADDDVGDEASGEPEVRS